MGILESWIHGSMQDINRTLGPSKHQETSPRSLPSTRKTQKPIFPKPKPHPQGFPSGTNVHIRRLGALQAHASGFRPVSHRSRAMRRRTSWSSRKPRAAGTRSRDDCSGGFRKIWAWHLTCRPEHGCVFKDFYTTVGCQGCYVARVSGKPVRSSLLGCFLLPSPSNPKDDTQHRSICSVDSPVFCLGP